MNVEPILGDVITEFIGGSVSKTFLKTTTGQPQTKTVRIVIATVGSLRERRSPELTAEDDDRLFK